ncbi:MAG: S8 family serine peptidase [candidate division WOR-3 bacterium]|nr:S8 family serine peptidase [candidate division WOR-3 bacterium]
MEVLLVSLLVSTIDPCLVSHHTGTYTPAYLPEYDYISIAGYYFNPRISLPEIPAELSGKSDYYLIHFKGPVYEGMKQTIESYGVKLIQYIPFNAFIAKMDASKKAIIEGLPFVNWIGNYEPAFKLSTNFKVMKNEDRIRIQIFYEENEFIVKNRLQKIGCEILEVAVDQMVKIITVRTDLKNLSNIAQIPEVMYIEPWVEPVAVNMGSQWVVQTWKQKYRKVWNKGIRGEGQVVSTADTGILTSHDMFRDPAVPLNTWGNYPTHRKIIAYLLPTGSSAAFGDVAGGSWHGTHTAGTICGDDSYVGGRSPNDGMAIKSKMFFMDIGTSTGSLSVPTTASNLYLPPYQGNAGGAARVQTHSWGYQNDFTYNSYASQTDQFMWTYRDFLIVYAAGNNGPGQGTVCAPGTAKNIITAGSCDPALNARYISSFSSRGMQNGDRLKPTVVAPGGQFIWSSAGSYNNSYLGMAGTSMATPGIGGCGALVRQYFAKGFYPTGDSTPANAWSFIPASLVKAIIINSASNDIIGASVPEDTAGWGRVCLDDALYFFGDVRRLWVTYDSVSTGQYDEFVLSVNNQSEPLKITLVWTDYWASAGVNPAIVNNLDLLVTSPTGTQYRGNVYSGGQSAPGGSADTRNVEECVRRNVPEIGNWTIRVTGTNVPQGTNQPYALVVSGGLGPSTSPVLHITGHQIYDPPPGGNFNGRCDVGETVYLIDTLKNLSGVAVTNCTGVLRVSSPYITLIDSLGTFGNIPVGGTAHNAADQFSFSISASTPPGTFITFILRLSGSGGYSQDISFDLEIGESEVQVIWGPKVVQIAPGDTHFLYGAAYNPSDNRLYVTNAYETRIYMYSSDSFATYLGYISAPDTFGTDIKYCAYDNTFWFAADPNEAYPNGRRVFKINTSGTALRQFQNPAPEYPTGLAWLPSQRLLYLADRRTSLTPSRIYRCDTLGGNVTSFNVPASDSLGARGMAIEPYGPDTTLLLVYTHFGGGSGSLVAIRLYELRRSDGAILNQMEIPGWNVRGVEYDPRDGNYWLVIAQNPARALVKVLGFRGLPGVGIGESGRPGPMEKISLSPGLPTPFRRNVKFTYSVPVRMRVKLVLYDIAGRLVKTFVNGEVEPGIKTVVWNGIADDRKQCASGVYLCYLETDHGTLVRKFVLAR